MVVLRARARLKSRPSALDATFVALADPSRRGVIELLRDKPRRAGELADRLGLTPPAMSRHLRVLRTTGLVARELDDTDARATLYRLRPQRLVQLRAWLEDIERFWSLQLDAFARHAEGQQVPPKAKRR